MRTITGTIHEEGGGPWADAPVLFELMTNLAVNTAATVIKKSETGITDASGNFSVDLETPDEDDGLWRYQCTMPDGQRFTFLLGPGMSISISSIIENGGLAGNECPDVGTGGGDGIEEAPEDGNQYGRQSQEWTLIDVLEAPEDGKPRGRQDGTWVLVDEAGSADAVQDNLTAHAGETTDAHGGIVADSDSRLSDARTPTAHASTHAKGGTDPLTPAAIGADVEGSAQTVQDNLTSHTNNADNPHSVTYDQAGADQAGSAQIVQDNLTAHADETYNLSHALPAVATSLDPGVDAAMQALADAGIILYGMLYIFNDQTTHTLTGVAGDSVWYPYAVERQPGQIVLFDTTIDDVAQTIEFGFDTDEAGSLDANALRIVGGDLEPVDGGVAGPDIAYPASGTPYQFAVILRAAGAFYFSDGTLLARYGSDASTPVYAGFANTSATGTVDGARAPQALWAPTPLAADTGTSVDVAGTYYTDGGTLTGIEAGGADVAWNGDTWSNGPDGAKNSPVPGENSLPNGGFDTDSGWVGSGWTVADGVATAVNGGNFYYPGTVIAGTWYFGEVQCLEYTSGSVAPELGNLGGVGLNISAAGSYIFVGRGKGSNSFGLRGHSFYGVLDNASIAPIATDDLFRSITTGTTPFIYVEAEGTLGDGVQAGTVMMLDDAADPQNFIIVYHDGASCIADKCVAGVYTNLFTQSAPEVPGVLPTATTRDNGDGTAQLWVWYDGYIADVEIADAEIVANTQYGIFSTSDTNRITNFTAYETSGHELPGA